ncbi:MAG: hypothetical protein JKY03_02065 [Aureispira sp.]|nr:hypothetical protein [Aureispira sp.]
MKTTIFFILIISLLNFSNSYAQANLKFNQTFSSMNAVHVDLDIKSNDIIIKTIKGSRIVIEMLINISSPNMNLLEFIAEGGRYDLKKSFNDETKTLILTAKKHKDIITIKGKEIKEEVSYVIYLPESMQSVHDTIAANF